MKGTPDGFWGKLECDDRGQVVAWHPLAAHCADVGACAEALLQHTLLGKRLATLAGKRELSPSDVARLAFLATLHDIGKFNLGFQRKADPSGRETAGHVGEVLALFTHENAAGRALADVLPMSQLHAWTPDEGSVQLLVASIGHHGKPTSCHGRGVRPELWRRDSDLDPFAGMAELVALGTRWFPEAFDDGAGHLPSSSEFQHAFAGLVMLADWLGSDRHDSFFPFATTNADRMAFARGRARDALRHVGLDVGVPRRSLGSSPPSFSSVSTFDARDAQRKTLELSAGDAGSLAVLESETGSGKTEAALARFVRLLQAGLVDGLTFALPTRSAATQLHERVVAALQRAFPEAHTRPPVVLAVPGYLQVDDTKGRRLPGFEVLWNDDATHRLRYRGWAAEHPKRFLAGSTVVGTIDQVLLSPLRVGHAHLRATALLRHLLVVDEVHASDAYMNRILEEVLRFHLAAGGHALLMSATLGGAARERLEQAAMGERSRAAADSLSYFEACHVPYPAVHLATPGGGSSTVAVEAPGLPKDIAVTVEPLAARPTETAARALAAARLGARVLVVRNTVTDAIATQLALEQLATAQDEPLLFRLGQHAALHHARFARPDRTALDHEIEVRFGKKASASGGAVAVATQTVQQSLDLDADLLLTDLAPMDVLLQRLGRVHRHRARDPHRPHTLRQAQASVLVDGEPLASHIGPTGEARGPHGIGTVYEDVLVLEATRRRLLRDGMLHVPAQNRELVETATHPGALQELAETLGEPWLRHRQAIGGLRFAHLGLATLNLVDRKRVFGDYSFHTTELEERVASRLGESDRQVVFEQPLAGPFGSRVTQVNIPGWLIRGIELDPLLAPTDVTEGVGDHDGPSIRFVFGGLAFVYDRLGLRRRDDANSAQQTDNSEVSP